MPTAKKYATEDGAITLEKNEDAPDTMRVSGYKPIPLTSGECDVLIARLGLQPVTPPDEWEELAKKFIKENNWMEGVSPILVRLISHVAQTVEQRTRESIVKRLREEAEKVASSIGANALFLVAKDIEKEGQQK